MTLGGIEDESCNKFQTRGTKLEHGGKENKMNNF
jgi:hypothetical protein